MALMIENDVALEWMDRVRESVKPKPTSKALVNLLAMVNDLNLWVACRESEVKGIMSDADFAAKLAEVATCGIGCGVAIKIDGLVALLVRSDTVTIGDVQVAPQQEHIVIDCPGREEARLYVRKIIERRNKRGDDTEPSPAEAAPGDAKASELPGNA